MKLNMLMYIVINFVKFTDICIFFDYLRNKYKNIYISLIAQTTIIIINTDIFG